MTDSQFERFIDEFRELKYEITKGLRGIKEELERLREIQE